MSIGLFDITEELTDELDSFENSVSGAEDEDNDDVGADEETDEENDDVGTDE